MSSVEIVVLSVVTYVAVAIFNTAFYAWYSRKNDDSESYYEAVRAGFLWPVWIVIAPFLLFHDLLVTIAYHIRYKKRLEDEKEKKQ